LESSTKQLGLDVAFGETTYEYLADSEFSPDLFKQHVVNLKGYDTPTVTYAGTFMDLDKFLQMVSQDS
jgi:adenylate cyclase